jgi:hypothetical protein
VQNVVFRWLICGGFVVNCGALKVIFLRAKIFLFLEIYFGVNLVLGMLEKLRVK